jgi:hypothetical protein
LRFIAASVVACSKVWIEVPGAQAIARAHPQVRMNAMHMAVVVQGSILFRLVVVVLMVACADKPTAPVTQLTPPVTQLTPSLGAPDDPRSSTICRSYNKRLNSIKAQLVPSPTTPELERKANAYRRIIADACS